MKKKKLNKNSFTSGTRAISGFHMAPLLGRKPYPLAKPLAEPPGPGEEVYIIEHTKEAFRNKEYPLTWCQCLQSTCRIQLFVVYVCFCSPRWLNRCFNNYEHETIKLVDFDISWHFTPHVHSLHGVTIPQALLTTYLCPLVGCLYSLVVNVRLGILHSIISVHNKTKCVSLSSIERLLRWLAARC